MAKFGWNEEQLFYVDYMSVQDQSSDPGAPSAEQGALTIYSKDDSGNARLYIRDASEEILIPIDAVDAAAVTGQSLVKQKNSDGELEFYSLKSTSGHLDIALNGDDIELTVDVSDINDELDHGLLLGLDDDDHQYYFHLPGRSGGQIAEGGTDAGDDLELKSTDSATKGEVKIIDGSDFRVNGRIFKNATGATTDASESDTVFSIPLEEAKRYYFKVVATAQSADEAEYAMLEQSQAAYRKTAGSAVLQGNQNSQHKTRTSNQMTVTFGVSANNVDVVVDQGNLTPNVDWELWLEVFEK